MRVATFALCALAGVAGADEPRNTPAAVEVDRETSPPGRAELSFDAGGPVSSWALGLSLGHISEPIVLRTTTLESLPVDQRTTLTLGGALALGDAVVLDARMSAARQTGDRLAIFGMPRALDRWVPRDLALGARVRVVGAPHGAAFLRAELSLPTGDDRDFAGEPSWTLAWALIARAHLPAGIVLAGTAGIRLRGAEVIIANRLVSDELFGGGGVLVPLPAIRPLWCDPEQLKLTAEVVGILGNDVGGDRGPSPVEVRAGFVGTPRPGFLVGLRGGAGLDNQIGAPTWRATLELTYRP